MSDVDAELQMLDFVVHVLFVVREDVCRDAGVHSVNAFDLANVYVACAYMAMHDCLGARCTVVVVR